MNPGPATQTNGASGLRAIGVIVHPSRNIDTPLRHVFDWAQEHDVAVIQVPVLGQDRVVADLGEAADCDLIVSIGGDGTMLAAVRAAVEVDRPVLGVSCGSLGVLTAVQADAVGSSLDRFTAGDWSARRLPALSVAGDDGSRRFAINDVAIVRGGIGQVRVTISVDGTLFSRLAGDGAIVSTPVGSSAYSLAAGGPLLAPDTEAFLVTPLPTHGGSRQPLVVGARSELVLEVSAGVGGARLELDGQLATDEPQELRIGMRPAVATLVAFAEQDSLFDALRRRRIIVDSPRLVADDERAASRA